MIKGSRRSVAHPSPQRPSDKMLPTLLPAALSLLAPVLASEYDLYRFLLEDPHRAAGAQRRQVTRTCLGQTVFQTCPDGVTCAPSGYYCCGRE